MGRVRVPHGASTVFIGDFGHTYGSLLAAAWIPVPEIQAAMGHSDTQTTARYLHARPASEQVERFVRAFDA